MRLLLLGFLLLFSIGSSYAYSPYLNEIQLMYNQGYSCMVCHQKEGLTSFGTTYKGLLSVPQDPYAIKELLKQKDSDRDGFSDDTELEKGSWPSDPKDTPH